jgi:predicted DNA-binding transcriptional regulator YafY|tara:strand:- start:3550 stop:3858 length:309 start_codon:yes stop_codon:yes gene_type:complete
LIEETLKQEDGIWLNNNKFDVLLKISEKAAGYFKRRALIDNQVIEEELSSGELIISAKIGHPDQIIPIIRYWIPHITVLNPATIKEKVEQSLHQYLNSLHPL